MKWFWNDAEKRLKVIETKVSNIPETVDCEICGCMVRKEVAVKGKSEVRERFNGRLFSLFFIHAEDEYLYTPYFCKRCAPKDRYAIAKKAKKRKVK